VKQVAAGLVGARERRGGAGGGRVGVWTWTVTAVYRHDGSCVGTGGKQPYVANSVCVCVPLVSAGFCAVRRDVLLRRLQGLQT
jgi:hypothetical protein